MVRARATAIRSDTGGSGLTIAPPLPSIALTLRAPRAPPASSSWIHPLQVDAQARLRFRRVQIGSDPGGVDIVIGHAGAWGGAARDPNDRRDEKARDLRQLGMGRELFGGKDALGGEDHPRGRLAHPQIVPWGAVDPGVSLFVRLVDVEDGPVRPDAGNHVDLLARVGIAHRDEAAGLRHVRAAEPADRLERNAEGCRLHPGEDRRSGVLPDSASSPLDMPAAVRALA